MLDYSDYIKPIFAALEEMYKFMVDNITVREDEKIRSSFEHLKKNTAT